MSEESAGTTQECVAIILREYLSTNSELVRDLTELLKDEGIITRQQKNAIYKLLKSRDVNQALERTIDFVSTSKDGLLALMPALQSEELSDAFDERIAKVIEVLLKPETDGSLAWIVLSWSDLLFHETEVKTIINEVWPGGLQFSEDDSLHWLFHFLYFCVTDGQQNKVADFVRSARDALEIKEFQHTGGEFGSPESRSDLKSVQFQIDEETDFSEDGPPPDSFVILDSDGDQAQSCRGTGDGQVHQDGSSAIQERVGPFDRRPKEPIGNQRKPDVVRNRKQPSLDTSIGMESVSITGVGQLLHDQESQESHPQQVPLSSYASNTSSELNREVEITAIREDLLPKRTGSEDEVPHGGDEEPVPRVTAPPQHRDDGASQESAVSGLPEQPASEPESLQQGDQPEDGDQSNIEMTKDRGEMEKT